jgi:transposase
MKEKILKYIEGRECPRCRKTHLYQMSDNRFKCHNCLYKYSYKKIRDDFNVLHYFSLEIPANKAAKDLGMNYKAVRSKYMQYRQEIYNYLQQEFNKLSGEIECDESYFGGKRKGLRGRGSAGKIKVFGMLERQGRIFTTIVDNVTAETLLNEIKSNSEKGSVFYTDKFRSYKSLKFYGKHLTIDHNKYFKNGRRHINGLEGFWSFAKERLLKYHGINKNNFLLYLKEMEFRYNYKKENLFNLLIKIHFRSIFT